MPKPLPPAAAETSKRWPKYIGVLKTPLRPGDDLTVQVPDKLAALCRLHGIDPDGPLWERELLVTLSLRNVPGFGFRSPTRARVDNDWIIASVEFTKDVLEGKDKDGVRPSDDAAVANMIEELDKPGMENENQFLRDMLGKRKAKLRGGDTRDDLAKKALHSRVMRIYSGRKDPKDPTQRRIDEAMKGLGDAYRAARKLSEASSESHAAILIRQHRSWVVRKKP